VRAAALVGLVKLIGTKTARTAASSRYWAKSSRSEPATCRHGFDLRVTAHTAYRQAHVNRGPDATIEKVRLKINLSVRNRNHIGGNVGGDVARLRLNYGQCREGARAQLVVELRGALQQTRVKIEHVARERFSPREGGASSNEISRYACAVLGKIVVKADGGDGRNRGKIRPIAQAAYGAMYCNVAGSVADAATTMV